MKENTSGMAAFLREQFPVGTRIRLTEMDDPYAPVPPGTMGTLEHVDDAGQFLMRWDNGRTLSLIPGRDTFTVIPPEFRTLKLYMPLTADFYEYDCYGDMRDECVNLDGSSLRAYADTIAAALLKYRSPEEKERGLMHWYGERDALSHKVNSIFFDVEERAQELWGVAECRVAGTLNAEELESLKDYVTGQASDGWGEGFEQREIKVNEGELFVHLWDFHNWSIQTEEECFQQ